MKGNSFNSSKYAKLLCLILCFTLLLAVFAGCGKTNQNDAATSTDKEGKTNQTADMTREEKFNLSSQPEVELVIAQPWINLDNTEGIKNDRILNYLQEKLKIKFKFITSNEYSTKINLMLATGETLDFVSDAYDGNFTQKLFSEDLILNVKDLVLDNQKRYPVLSKVFNDPLYKFINEMKFGDSTNYSGIYSFGSIVNPNTTAFVINGGILEQTGLDIPKTIDELINLMRTVKKVLPDVVPFFTPTFKGTDWSNLGNQLFRPYGVVIFKLFNDNGVYKENFTSDAAKEAWIRVQHLYKEGLFDKEMVTRDVASQWVEGVVSDKVAISGGACIGLGNFSGLFQEYLKAHPDAKPGVDLILTEAPLTGPAGSTINEVVPYDVGNCTSFIPKSSKYPERVLDLVNYLFSNEGMNDHFWGIEGVHYTGNADDKLITSDDQIDWNRDEYFKEVQIYYKDNTVRQEWNPFAYVGPIAYGAFSVESSKDLLDALSRFVPIINLSYVEGTDYGEYDIKYTNSFGKQMNIEPFYMSKIVLSEEGRQRDIKLREIRNKWYTSFLVGDKDVSENWGNFVKELRDAELEQYIADYNDVVTKAKSIYEKHFK